VVVLTGRTFDELGSAAVDAGAHDFLTKGSIDAPGLARVLRVAMRRNAVHFREVHAAHHDSLTGLANRSHFQSSLVVGCSRAKRGDQCGLIFIDVNNFKAVNDRFGHRVGDAVLVAVADRIRPAVRCDDVVARWGGDEFAVLLGTVASDFDAQSAADRIAAAVNRELALTLEPTGETTTYDLSVSVGVALSGIGERALDEQEMLAAADGAMYDSKARSAPYMFANAFTR
jgi:diguanylate cyclase (GGDEF)-like protein